MKARLIVPAKSSGVGFYIKALIRKLQQLNRRRTAFESSSGYETHFISRIDKLLPV